MLPEGWSVLKLDDVVTKTQLGTTERGTEDKSSSNSIPLIKMGNLGWGSINFKKVEMIDKSYFDESLLLERGDFLFNTRNTPDLVGKSAVWLEDYPATFDNNINRISFKPVINSYYISYYLNNGKGKSLIQALPAGSTSVAAIYWKDLKNIKLVLPPLPEQKKIAQILSTWDNAISATKRLLENSQQRKKALMQQLLTGKKRLPGFEEEWKSGTLAEIANIDSGYAFKSSDFTDSEEGIPIVKMSDFKEGRLDLSQAAKVSTNYLSNIDKFKLQVGDFVFGMSGSLSNYAWVKVENLPCYLNQRVGRIVSKKNANHLFVTYLYLSDKVQQSILDKAAGAAQLNISVTDLRKLPVKYPSKIEQQAIANILTTADQEIDALQKRLEHLKLEKKALMQQLLTGKRRVVADVDAA
ncbi:TPA: restriction endonuclease subunit S [Morganella morganii subsp. morganii]|nr:restriction endonuclease subunit S [Morganella morganii subsp. morganii]